MYELDLSAEAVSLTLLTEFLYPSGFCVMIKA